MIITTTVIGYLEALCHSIYYLFNNDYQSFRAVFPNTYPLLYPTLRIIPLAFFAVFFAVRVTPWLLKQTNTFKTFCSIQLPVQVWVFLLLCIGVLIRVYYAVNLPLFIPDGDAMSRLEETKAWFNNPEGIPGGLMWLPLHHWLLMAPSVFGIDIMYGSRAITVALGILTLPVFYKLVEERFNKHTALLGLLILSLNPFHVKYSVITMSEVPFIFFALLALWFLFMYIKKNSRVWLFASALCINACSLLRFEGWYLAMAYPVILFGYRKQPPQAISYMALCSISIVLYMWVSMSQSGHLVYGLYMSNQELFFAHERRSDKLYYIVENLRHNWVFPIWLLILGLPTVGYCIVKQKQLLWLLMALFGFSMVAWKVLNLTSEPFWRYFSTYLFLLLPFGCYALIKLGQKIRIATFLFCSTLIVHFSIELHRQYDFLTHLPNVANGFFETANWIKQHCHASEKVLYDSTPFDDSGFRLLSNVRWEEMYYPHTPSLKKFDYYENFTPEVLQRIVENPEYKYMVYKKGLIIDSLLPTTKLPAPIKQHRFGNYTIWQLRQ